MMHRSCRGIEYFIRSVGLLAEYFVAIFWCADTAENENNNQSLGASLLSFMV